MSNDTLIITNTELLTEAADDSSLVSHDVELTSVYIDNIETVVDKTEELTLLEVGTQGPPGAGGGGGGVFILDVQGIGGIVGQKTYDLDGATLATALSDTTNVRVTVGADGGGTAYFPVVTLNTYPITMTETATKRWFTGQIDLVLGAGANQLLVENDSGASDTALVTLAGAGPAVLLSTFGSYPIGQSELKAGDTVALTVNTQPEATSVTIQAAGASATTQTWPVVAGVATGTITVSGLTGQQVVYLSAKNALGTEGAGAVTPYLTLNQTHPTLGPISVSYPGAQGAFLSGDVGTLSMTATDFNTIAYSSSVVAITDPTTYVPTKDILLTSTGYQGTGTNITVTATRTANGAVTARTGLIKYATVAPTAVISIAGNPARLVSSPAGTDYEVRITPSQDLSSPPTLSAFAGTWQGVWSLVSGSWRRNLRIDDTTTKGLAIFSGLSVTGLSGLTGSAITAGSIYTVGGISSRTLTVPAFSRTVAIGTQVTDQTKTTCSIAGGAALTRYTDNTPRAGGYYISDASGNYLANGTYVALSDVSFAGANTTGSLQLTFAEAA